MVSQMLGDDIQTLRAAHAQGLFASSKGFARAAAKMAQDALLKQQQQQQQQQQTHIGAAHTGDGGGAAGACAELNKTAWQLLLAELHKVTNALDICRGVLCSVDALSTKQQLVAAAAPLVLSAARFLHGGGPWADAAPAAAEGGVGVGAGGGGGGLGGGDDLARALTVLHPHEFHSLDRGLADAIRREATAAVDADAAVRATTTTLAAAAAMTTPLSAQLLLARWAGLLRVAV